MYRWIGLFIAFIQNIFSSRKGGNGMTQNGCCEEWEDSHLGLLEDEFAVVFNKNGEFKTVIFTDETGEEIYEAERIGPVSESALKRSESGLRVADLAGLTDIKFKMIAVNPVECIEQAGVLHCFKKKKKRKKKKKKKN
jgi:hypothetical protein